MPLGVKQKVVLSGYKPIEKEGLIFSGSEKCPACGYRRDKMVFTTEGAYVVQQSFDMKATLQQLDNSQRRFWYDFQCTRCQFTWSEVSEIIDEMEEK